MNTRSTRPDAVERFMVCNGILRGTPADAAPSRIFHYDDLFKVCTAQAGLFRNLTEIDERVRAGQALAEVIDPCTGEALETLRSSADGVVFFRCSDPLIYAHTAAYKILRDAE